MATVYIEKRNRKNGVSYRVLYKDPTTLKTIYYESYRKYRDALEKVAELRTILNTGKIPKRKNKRLHYLNFNEVAEKVKNKWTEKLNDGELSQEIFDGYLLRIEILCDTFGKKFIASINDKEIKKFRTKQFKEMYAATSNRNLLILKQVFKKGKLLGANDTDPAKNIRYLSEKEHVRKIFLIPDEILDIVQASVARLARTR